MHWIRFELSSFRFGTISNSFDRCFCLASCRAEQRKMKCSLSSASCAQSSQVLSTSHWLNLCLLACSVYVPVSIRAFIAALSISWGSEPVYL